MQTYLDILSEIIERGERKTDRTGTGTLSLFGAQCRYDLRDGFPLLTTKKVLFTAVVRELLWFIKGATNIHQDLTAHTPIWDAWADENGELGPIYGYQWRHWEQFKEDGAGGVVKGHVDQLVHLLKQLKENPDSRRHIISAWNVADIDRMALPPCHTLFQFYVCNGFLDCQLYQRSADFALGVPFNIASYSLLLMMVAQECGYIPRYFVHTFGDAHVYLNHLDGVRDQLIRTPGVLPTVSITSKPFFDIQFEDIQLHNYQHQAFIKFPIAV